MTPARRKSMTLLAGVLVAALALLAGTQDWFVLTLGGALPGDLVIPGTVAAPAQSAFGIASLALVAALALAGPVFRIVFGVLQMLLGACILLGAGVSLSDPIQASTSSLSEHTGLAGASSLRELVLSVAVSWPPYLGIATGILGVLLGLWIIVGTRDWPQSGRRYDTRPALRTERGGAVDWDALSQGVDPTVDDDETGASEGETSVDETGADGDARGSDPDEPPRGVR